MKGYCFRSRGGRSRDGLVVDCDALTLGRSTARGSTGCRYWPDSGPGSRGGQSSPWPSRAGRRETMWKARRQKEWSRRCFSTISPSSQSSHSHGSVTASPELPFGLLSRDISRWPSGVWRASRHDLASRAPVGELRDLIVVGSWFKRQRGEADRRVTASYGTVLAFGAIPQDGRRFRLRPVQARRPRERRQPDR